MQTRLPLNGVHSALKDVIPRLTRSSLHRCLQRHGISRLPNADREKPKKFKDCAIGYLHIDIAERRYDRRFEAMIYLAAAVINLR